MFEKLLARLSGDGPEEPLPEQDARVAVAAVLVTAARSDGDYAEEERRLIDRVLATNYGLPPQDAARLRTDGETAEAEAAGLVRFTRAIKQAVPHSERVAVIEAVWEIAYADGERSDEESALVRKLCGLLYVEDRDAGLARQRVAARLGLE